MKEQNKTPEKELNEMEIVSLSDAEFKTLVIRMLKELTECGSNIKDEMKATLCEIKNLQGDVSEGQEAGFKSLIWNIKKKETFNQSRKKKQKNEDSIRRLWDTFKRANI